MHCCRGHTAGSLDTAKTARKHLVRTAGSCTVGSGLLLLAQNSFVGSSLAGDQEVPCTAIRTAMAEAKTKAIDTVMTMAVAKSETDFGTWLLKNWCYNFKTTTTKTYVKTNYCTVTAGLQTC